MVTAYSEYAVKAFELEVDDYILKPFGQRRLEKMLRKCGFGNPSGQENVKPEERKRIAINTDGKAIYEEVENIVYIETCNRGCMIHTDKNEYYEGKTIGDFEKRLKDMGFFRSQKSYLINLGKVKELFLWGNNSFAVKMEGYDKEVLPVGREKIKVLRQLLGG